jgi:hypothetical protein
VSGVTEVGEGCLRVLGLERQVILAGRLDQRHELAPFQGSKPLVGQAVSAACRRAAFFFDFWGLDDWREVRARRCTDMNRSSGSTGKRCNGRCARGRRDATHHEMECVCLKGDDK